MNTGARRAWAVGGLFLLFAAVRLWALDSDPPPSLDWTSGIWTDEGFYTYGARNAVLFGGTTDEFHPEVLSPVLDWGQRTVFRAFGVSLGAARTISVACSLGTLLLFWDALRRSLGAWTALAGLVFLGGDAIFLFYNHLALLETPAALVVCAAFWAWTWGRPWAWALAGALAVSALAFKTTFLLFLPLPALVWAARGAWRPLGWYGLGAALGAGAYWLGWGAAHGAEVVRLNHYYWTHQSQPRSLAEVGAALKRALFGPHRSVLGFLLSRSPVLTLLALAGLAWPPRRGRAPRPQFWTHWTRRGRRMGTGEEGGETPPPLCLPRIGAGGPSLRRDTERLLWLWAVLGLGFLCLTRYAPTRYDLVVLPALAGLAAISLRRLPLRLKGRTLARIRRIRVGVLAVALAVGLGQWGAWAGTRGHRVRDVGRGLARIVPPGGTVAGDWAPELCLSNHLRGVPVLPDLANGRDPLATLRPDFILVTQTPYPMGYWARAAPNVVRPENIAARFRVHDYRLILYRVPKGYP